MSQEEAVETSGRDCRLGSMLLFRQRVVVAVCASTLLVRAVLGVTERQ
jgi:hypothetical protein